MQQIIIASSGSRKSDDSTDLLNYLEIEFINMVNDVGVDLNRCNQSPHTSNCLQFVCGLGPRKAQNILKVLRQARFNLMSRLGSDKQIKTYPVAVSRVFLVTKCDVGRRVLINSAGFIKFDVDKISKEIEEDEDDNDKEDVELLDSTRIHPEHYEWARKMAIDALDFDDNNDSANSQSALKEILYENPKRLKDLDLDAFAAELIRTGYGNKTTTLYDIRTELSSRYRDRRIPFQPMNSEMRFLSLTKESQNTFYVGKLIMCKVNGIARKRPNKEQLDEANPFKDDNTCMWVCSFCKRNDFNDLSKVWSHFDSGECPGPPIGVRTQLDNGCNGFIALKNLSDNNVINPEERIKVGMVIHTRVKRIDFEKLTAELTSKTSDLKDINDQWKPKKDPYYDYRAFESDELKIDEKKKKEEHKQTYTKRVIAHPQFKNIGYQQAINHLKEMEIGECIIRPSSKGIDHLTITWKVYNNCYQHVDVLEEKKINSFSVGKRLIIDGEDFEDLDEIIARYINPMTNFVKEIISHKNFKDLSSNEDFNNIQKFNENYNINNFNQKIEKYLLEERTKVTTRIPYLFACCVNFPGKFLLSYMIKLKVRNEYITVTHEGFKFRLKMFKSFNELISWFKLHFNDPLPINTLSQLSHSNTQINDSINRNQQQITNNFDSISIHDNTRSFDKLSFNTNNFDHSRNIGEKLKKQEINRYDSISNKMDRFNEKGFKNMEKDNNYDLNSNFSNKLNHLNKPRKQYERNQTNHNMIENSFNDRQNFDDFNNRDQMINSNRPNNSQSYNQIQQQNEDNEMWD